MLAWSRLAAVVLLSLRLLHVSVRFLISRRLEEVLELAVSSSLRVRGGMHDADEMLRDVADELEGKRAKSSQDLTGSEERGRGKERTGNGDDEELVRYLGGGEEGG